ncbi:hypothetical protein PTSG_03066 [Salpingoeca rosetta]|uniref:Uncharacterized protein n=1 Tax=Salpingoeca rosetta (strain ATCC 50818 / BSB-021) TaxID=946362 RepID=F2U456_SALR5|nr:uncharacterized protein PTSG_03066 [Salpingoeca rosetta]EGD82422.1 hypothetical protein PTSG_03066 [Salpingoeca rosetta]|eukprot:XP_004995658.1 hypothetical protein PTSG_03066 [Salpingoeca rosetta]
MMASSMLAASTLAGGVVGVACAWFGFVVWLQWRRQAHPPGKKGMLEVAKVICNPRRVARISLALAQQLALLQHWRLWLQWTLFYRQPHSVHIQKELLPDGCLSTVDHYFVPGCRTTASVLFLYGSGWDAGDKAMYALLGKYFAQQQHFDVLIPSYNTYPHGCIRVMLKSVLEILLWHHQSLNQPMHVVAHSAGAHIIHTLILHIELELLHRQQLPSCCSNDPMRPQYLHPYSTDQLLCAGLQLRSVTGLSGPYDIDDHFEHERSRGVEWASVMWRVMGGHQHFPRFSPVKLARHITTLTHTVAAVGDVDHSKGSGSDNTNHRQPLPPQQQQQVLLWFLPHIRWTLVHGDKDYVVPLTSTQRLARALLPLAGPQKVALHVVDSDHIEIMLALHDGSSVHCMQRVREIVSRAHAAPHT